MSLEVCVRSMTYEPVYSGVRSPALRSFLRLPPIRHRSQVIQDFELTIERGEVVAIIGASGAGKTTLLRILAGVETSYDGYVKLDGDQVTKPNRRVYLMPQEHTLLPWRNVERNLAFNFRNGTEESRLATPDRLLGMFKLSDKRYQYPHSLSGGERARVALMCAMCAMPEILLLDEPFRGLDQLTMERCQDDLVRWLGETKAQESVVLVSHSIADAVFLADRVVVVGSRPLRPFAEFVMPNQRIRRSEESTSLEERVLDALVKVQTGNGNGTGC